MTKGRDRKWTCEGGQRPHSQSPMSSSVDWETWSGPWSGRAGVDTAAQAEKDGVRVVNVLSEQGPRSTIHSPFQKKKSLKKKNPDYTEKYRFKCLTFLMRGSFSSFYLVHPLFIYLRSVLRCLELSPWRGSVLLRLEGGAPVWRLWEGLLELLCICMEWWAWCQDMDHSFTPSNEYRLRTG